MAKRKQGHLPGMEPPSIKEIDAAAEAYVRARNARVAKTEVETETREVLQAAMKKHELTAYQYDGKIVLLATNEKVSVKEAPDEPETSDDE